MTEGALRCGRRTIACLLRKPIHVSLSCFVMIRGERPVSGRAGRAAVAACHGMSYLLMLCHGSDGGRPPGGRRGRGSGRERTWAAAPSFGSCSSGAPARHRSDPLSRAFACGRGRVSAPARFARLIARARGRHRAHFACRLNRGRSAPGRCGRAAVHGVRFPWTHHSTVSENASPVEKYYMNFSNNLPFTPAGRRIPMSSQELVWIG